VYVRFERLGDHIDAAISTNTPRGMFSISLVIWRHPQR
jgi:hypothetical protein